MTGPASLRIKDVAKVLVGSADKIGDAALQYLSSSDLDHF